jgi:hypothetical protein
VRDRVVEVRLLDLRYAMSNLRQSPDSGLPAILMIGPKLSEPMSLKN